MKWVSKCFFFFYGILEWLNGIFCWDSMGYSWDIPSGNG